MRGHYYHYKVGEALAWLFPKKISQALSASFAWVYARTLSTDIETVMDNLRRALPSGTSQAVLRERAREVIVNFASYLVDFFYSSQLSDQSFIEDRMTLSGLENIQRELTRGKGVILASAHLGNWEMGGMTLARLGYPIYGIAARHRDPRVEKIFEERRTESGLRIIPLGNSIRQCYRILRENKVLALNADRLYGERGVEVEFLKKKVRFPQGITRLSQTTGTAVLPAFFIRTGFNRYLFEVQEPLKPLKPQLMVQNFANRLEEKIRRYPTQWFIFQPFWESAEWPV